MVKLNPIKLKEWNETFSPGHPCLLRLDDGTEVETKTRSEAWNIGGGFTLIMVEGKAGGWSIDRVKMMETHKL